MQPTRADKLERLMGQMSKQLTILSREMRKVVEDNEQLWIELQEINYRSLFTMQYFQFRRATKSDVLDPVTHQPIQGEPIVTTLYDHWLTQRDSFIAKVQAHEKEIIALTDAADAASHTLQGAGVGNFTAHDDTDLASIPRNGASHS